MTMSERDAKRSVPVRAEEPTDRKPITVTCSRREHDKCVMKWCECSCHAAALPPVQEPPKSEPVCETCGHKWSVIEAKGHGPACWGTPEELAPRSVASPSQGVRLDDLKAHVRAIQRAVEMQLPEDEPDDVRPWVYETAVKVMIDRLSAALEGAATTGGQ